VSSDAVIPELAGLSGANLMAIEHAELVVALYAAVTALDDNGLHREASAARAVLHGIAMRAVH
jgi:cobalamin biosynthesis protein CbiG